MSRIFIGKKEKQDLDTMKKKVNLHNKVKKEFRNLHAIIVGRLVTHQTNVGAMEKKNSMGSVTTATSMVTKPMNARRNQNLKVNVTNAKDMVTRHQNADSIIQSS